MKLTSKKLFKILVFLVFLLYGFPMCFTWLVSALDLPGFSSVKNQFLIGVLVGIGSTALFVLDWLKWSGMEILKNYGRTLADKPLRLLKAFRFVLPRAGREDLDIVIADLEEDLAEMKQQKRSRRFIFTVLLWHAVRTISAYFLDGARGLLMKLMPFLRYFTKG